MKTNSEIKKGFSFKKSERLCSHENIKELFKSSSSLFSYPFKVVYIFQDVKSETSNFQILISVPKRNFKKAVDRNLIKRRSREAFRLQAYKLRELLAQNPNKNLVIGLIYTSKNIEEFKVFEKAMNKMIAKIG